MKTATKTRTQRRMEKKQTLILLLLVLAVALASFFLGALVGRQGAERELAQRQQEAERILVTPAPQPPTAAAPAKLEEQVVTDIGAAKTVEKQPELTFYDKLAQEEKVAVPLGSGINLPPQPPAEQQPAAKPPIDLPEQPVVKKTVPVTVAKTETAPVPAAAVAPRAVAALPKIDPQGNYAVQLGSFAAAGDAGAFKQKLIAKGYPTFVAEADLGAKGLWYRVKVGPYANSADAKIAQQLIADKDQIKGFVTRR